MKRQKNGKHTHTRPSQYMSRKLSQCCVMYTRTEKLQQKQKRENTHTDRCGNTCRKKCSAKGSGKEDKIQEFRYRDTMNVEHET